MGAPCTLRCAVMFGTMNGKMIGWELGDAKDVVSVNDFTTVHCSGTEFASGRGVIPPVGVS